MICLFAGVVFLVSCGCNKDKVVKIMTYNVGAFAKEIDDSTPLIVKLIETIGAETVGLNEVDSCNRRHMVDQLAVLASQLGKGWDHQYGRAMAYKGGAYGNGVVTKAKVQRRGVIALPRVDGGEPRSAAYVETPDYVFAELHLDHKSDNARLEQMRVVTAELKKLFQGAGKPVFLAGDFNAIPGNTVIQEAGNDWEILTPPSLSFPSDKPRICIDYIMMLKGSGHVEVISAGLCTADQFSAALGPDIAPHVLSDHLPLYLEVRL